MGLLNRQPLQQANVNHPVDLDQLDASHPADRYGKRPAQAPTPVATRYEHEEIVRANEYRACIALLEAKKAEQRAMTEALCEYADKLIQRWQVCIVDLTAHMNRHTANTAAFRDKLREMDDILAVPMIIDTQAPAHADEAEGAS